MRENSSPAKPAFRGRPLVSVFMLIGMLVVGISGIVLYIAPPGRVAREIGWNFWLLDKGQWMGLHMAFGLVFVLTTLFHVWFNGRTLLNHIWQRASEEWGASALFTVKAEALVAVLVCLLLGVTVLADVFPGSLFNDLRGVVEEYWKAKSGG